MSDAVARRSFDTVVIPAALVFPGDPLPNMGPDAARIPVRVVWRESDAPADQAGGSGSATALPIPAANGEPDGDRGGGDLTPAVPAASGPERAPSPRLPRVDPIAKFMEANDALDRMSGGVGTAIQDVGYRTRNANNSTASS